MNTWVALAVGYAIGAKTRGKELDDVARSLKALCGTDEFADVIGALRAQVGATLREVAGVVDGHAPAGDTGGDLVAQVRHLVGRD